MTSQSSRLFVEREREGEKERESVLRNKRAWFRLNGVIDWELVWKATRTSFLGFEFGQSTISNSPAVR